MAPVEALAGTDVDIAHTGMGKGGGKYAWKALHLKARVFRSELQPHGYIETRMNTTYDMDIHLD